jgi:putative ubiquitin-RnfH superfamily antitoxin RatB of RatAB toxin-antitoxin module
MAADQINVQVCYATDSVVFLRDLRMEVGATVRQALEVSGLALEVPGIDLDSMVVGIYGKKKTLDTVLREHDRVEVYRPLIADPKNARRRRVRKAE